ncbi:MAG: SDR family oxidoreductase [Burkholderiaceae bacterium]
MPWLLARSKKNNRRRLKVFLTGASSGIGAALAKAYAARGAECALVARRIDALESLRHSLPRADAHRSFAVDVTDADALAAAAASYMQACGVPDIVIANAGISAGTDTGDPEDLAVFRRIVETNLIATVATFTPFVKMMREAPVPEGGRRLVVIASVAGVRGLAGSGAYSASKAAAISYAESLRIELHDTPIRVVTIAPGFIATPMTAGNPYPMPFLMPVDRFAERAVRAIASGTTFIVIPWQMGWVARMLRIMPNVLFDAAFAKAGRKPRASRQPIAAAIDTRADARTASHANTQEQHRD